jgi:hypothetical protein
MLLIIIWAAMIGITPVKFSAAAIRAAGCLHHTAKANKMKPEGLR